MADSKLADLTNAATLAQTDLLYAVRDPAGSPLDRKVTVATLGVAIGAGAAGPILASGYYSSWGGSQVPGESAALNHNQLRFLRFPVAHACTLDRIGLEITVGQPTSVVRLGIYDDVNGLPTNLILDAGTIDASTGSFVEITISQALIPGVVWLAAVPQVAGSIKWRTSNTGDAGGACDNTAINISQYAQGSFGTLSGTSGALPNPITVVDVNGGAIERPRIIVRVA